jgi:hypothetical protein
MNQEHPEPPADHWLSWLDEEMAEVLLLLPARQTAALERLAHARDLTVGQLIRLVLLDYLAHRRDFDRESEPERPGHRGRTGQGGFEGRAPFSGRVD